MSFKPICSISFGEIDASNYKNSYQRDFFNRVFLSDDNLNELKKPNKYFLIGDKGTGKTAYAVYLQNNSSEQCCSVVKTIAGTDYEKFIRLKQTNNLALSDYTDVWKLIILLLISEQIRNNEDNSIFSHIKFGTISKVIDEFYQNAFIPEILYAIQIAEEITTSTSIMAKVLEQNAGASSDVKKSIAYSQTSYQGSILYLVKQFIDALQDLKYRSEYIVFIDGIDVRPLNISYQDYLDCVKGLVNAVWYLNTEIFQKGKNSRKLRVVLLVRPDIIDEVGLQNLNSKIIDNGVMLNWVTSYEDYAKSNLFRMADRILNKQQDNSENIKFRESWDNYFPYKIVNFVTHEQTDSSFIDFLRFSFHRPRDIIMLLSLIKKYCPADTTKITQFPPVNMLSANVQQEYSAYLVGEIKDSLFFYQDYQDFSTFLSFFSYLKKYVDKSNRQFSYSNYLIAFEDFTNYCNVHKINISAPIYASPNIFLQTIFELNICSYLEEAQKSGEPPRNCWYFRERSNVNIRPRVRYETDYRFHKGLAAAFKIL